MILIRPATLEDAEYIGRNLRPEDDMEVRTATGGEDPREVVPRSYHLSRECYAVYAVLNGRASEKPVAIFGVCPNMDTPELGVVWLLATQEALKVSRSLMREAPRWLDHMARPFRMGLHNVADARNELHIRWCERSGFARIGELEINGHTFIHIHRPRQRRDV